MENTEQPFAFEEVFRRHQDVVSASLTSLVPDIQKASDIIAKALLSGKHGFTCGNGGSAADALHLSGEFLCRYKEDRKPFPVTALTAEIGALTAIANDYSFDDVFARQMTALGSEGDFLIAFTTSGSSKNVLKAIEAARNQKMSIIVLTGAKGEALRPQVDVLVAVPSLETARIQEVHEIVYHAWCERFDEVLRMQ